MQFGVQVHLFQTLASKTGLLKRKMPETKVFQAIKYGVTVWCNAGKGENMNSKNKQRISLYLDKETVEKMDSAIKNMVIVPATILFPLPWII